MSSQTVGNAVVHRRELLRAVCEISRIWLPREYIKLEGIFKDAPLILGVYKLIQVITC